jgi:hypothetical protein
VVGRPLRFWLFCCVALAALGVAGNASAARRTLASPTLVAPPPFATAPAPIHDRVLQSRPRTLADDQWWGGPITDSRGEKFNFYVSSQYPVDEAVRARWANFLGWALHGKELSSLSVYQAPLARVQQLCQSQDALACYYVNGSRLFFPGDAQDTDGTPLNLSEILLHEYGHHIASHRRNDPWPAFAYGPKRWASFENICQRATTGQVHPGDESQLFYLLNPGEAWAETYRLLNVQRAQQSNASWYQSWGAPLPWQWQAFSHTSQTLAAATKDVTSPWSGPRKLHWAGRTPRKTKNLYGADPTAQRRIYTPLDGTITIVLDSAPRGSYLTFGLGLTARKSITTSVCGQSSVLLKVSTVVSHGRFRVTIVRP